MKTIVVALLVWAEAFLGAEPVPLPNLTFREAAMIVEDAGVDGVVAYYEPDTATIVLPYDWDATNLADRAILLHELVHHVQFASGVKLPCAGAYERDAYEAERVWFAEQGLDAERLGAYDPFLVAIVTACGPAGR